MFSHGSSLAVVVASWIAYPGGAFRTDVVAPAVFHRRLPRRTPTTIRHLSRNYEGAPCDGNSEQTNRRNFLERLSASIAGTAGTALSPLLLPSSAYADEEESGKAIIDDAEALAKDEATIDKAEASPKDGSEIHVEVVQEEASENISTDDDKGTIDRVETLLKDESELDAEVVKEEADEKKSIEDEKELIVELEKEISMEESDSSTPEEVEKEAEKIKDETEALIKEEEQLKSETEEMITKIETIESEVQSLDAANNEAGEKDSKAEKTSEAFVEILKERVEQKEDLITRLKRQSENDIDPKTGKFKTMTPQEYKQRAKSTDVDFLQFLKDTLANEQEWEHDLEAFEGFLGKEFGPAVKELRKGLSPLVGEVEKDLSPIVREVKKEIRKDVAPAVEGALGQLIEKAELAVDGEVGDLKERASELIGKLRSIF